MSENNYILEYQKQSINTMSKGELLIRLFDEVLKNIKYASILLKENNLTASKVCTDKCKAIFGYLKSILDLNYSVSSELYRIYTFFIQEVIRAEVKRDAEILDKIVPLVQELRDTWVQASKLSHIQNYQAKAK